MMLGTAVPIIDAQLRELELQRGGNRTLVPIGEVIDMLLDMRRLVEIAVEPGASPEPITNSGV